jgi:hypothetical protein
MQNKNTFTITADMLATGKVQVVLKAPSYADLRNCRKAFPFDKAERGDRIGYVPDDLMLAALLVKINDEPVAHNNDLIERLDLFPLADRQALSAILIETFYLDKTQANQAASIARTKRLEPYDYRDIESGSTPSGSFGVRFMVPNSRVQIECERRYTGMEKLGVGLEEYMFAFCLVSINGQDVSEVKDKLSLLDNHDIADVQYATNYFVAVSTIDEEMRADLKKHKAAIKQQLLGSPVASAPPTTLPLDTPLTFSASSSEQYPL